MSDPIVKTCNCCRQSLTARQIVENPEVVPIGTAYLEHEDSDTHFYFFQHEIPPCGTSFVVDVEHFKQFISEPIPLQVLRGQEGCEGHCVNIHDLSSCEAECHFAPFRRFLLEMLACKKSKTKSGAVT